MKLYQTSGDATVYGGDFGGREQGNQDGTAYGFQTATGIPMNEVTNSVAMHDKSLKYHIARVTNHDTNLTKFALITNVMGNPKSAGDLTPELADKLGVSITEEPYFDKSLNQNFRWAKGDDAKNLTFEVVGELKNKKYADIETAKVVDGRLQGLSSVEDVLAFDNNQAVLYDEFKKNVADKGFDYKPESKTEVSSEAIARKGKTADKINAVEANAILTSGYEHDINDSDEEHKKKLHDTVAANYASAPKGEQQALTAFLALILFALGETEKGMDLLAGLGNGDEIKASHYDGLHKQNSGKLGYDGSYKEVADSIREGEGYSYNSPVTSGLTSAKEYLKKFEPAEPGSDGISSITLDPGHGKFMKGGKVVHDPGATGKAGTRLDDEDYLNMEMAHRVQGILENKYGYENISLTRDSLDQVLSSRFNSRISAASGAKTFVSIHFNATDENSNAKGGNVFMHSSATQSSRALGAYIGGEMSEIHGKSSVVVKKNRMGLTKSEHHKDRDAVLVEVAFTSHKDVQNTLTNRSTREQYLDEKADEIARGIHKNEVAKGRFPSKALMLAASKEVDQQGDGVVAVNNDQSVLPPVTGTTLSKGEAGYAEQASVEGLNDEALGEAQKLTAGLDLKDSTTVDNGWPPGVDSSVLDQALANKMNGLV